MRRESGFGTIEQKKSNFYWTHRNNGKRTRIRLHAENRKDAEVEVAILEAQKADPQNNFNFMAVAPVSIRRVSLKDAWSKFEKDPRCPECCESFFRQKQVIWEKFVAYCLAEGLVYLDEVSSNHLETWLGGLKNERSKKTLNNYLGVIKQIYSFFDYDRYFSKVKKFRVSPVSMLNFTKEQLELIFRAVDGEIDLKIKYLDEMAVLFRIGAYTGLRLKDACLLSQNDLDLDGELLNCMPHKTKNTSAKRVLIPLHPELSFCLRKLSRPRSSQFVLPNVSARYLKSPSSVQQDIVRIMDWALWENKEPGRRPPKAGKYGFHSFRHTFVSFCANAGVPLAFVQEIVGHTSVSVTRYYSHLTLDAMNQVIHALPVIRPVRR